MTDLAFVTSILQAKHLQAHGKHLEDRDITIDMLEQALKDIEEAGQRLPEGENISVFLNIILKSKKRGIKCLIERLEADNKQELRMAAILGMGCQGYFFHRPTKVRPAIPASGVSHDRSSASLQKETAYQTDAILTA